MALKEQLEVHKFLRDVGVTQKQSEDMGHLKDSSDQTGDKLDKILGLLERMCTLSYAVRPFPSVTNVGAEIVAVQETPSSRSVPKQAVPVKREFETFT